jgi:PAS domain S-box-containing protein
MNFVDLPFVTIIRLNQDAVMHTRLSKAFAGLQSSLPTYRQIGLLIAISAICVVTPLILLIWLQQKTESFRDRPAPLEQPLLNGRYRALNEYHSTATLVGGITTSLGLLSCLATVYALHRLHRELYYQTVKLQDSQNLVEAIAGSVTDSLFTLNSQGQIETFNPAAIGMFGYDPSEIIGKDLNLLLDPPIDNESTSGVPGMSNTDVAASVAEESIPSPHPQKALAYRKIGAPFPIELSIGNTPTHTRQIAIVRDVSRQEQTEAELRSRLEEVTRLSTDLTQARVELQTVYMTCHDLKSPLQAIAHLSEWIKADLTERVRADTQNQIDLLQDRVQRMEGLVGTILKSAPPQE